LEGDGLVLRRAYRVVPPHVDYSLTPLGQEAAAHMARVAGWIEESLPQMVAGVPKEGAGAKKVGR